jgi:hypothetical protein
VASDTPKPRPATASQRRQLARLRVEVRDDLTADEAEATLDLYLGRRATWSIPRARR